MSARPPPEPEAHFLKELEGRFQSHLEIALPAAISHLSWFLPLASRGQHLVSGWVSCGGVTKCALDTHKPVSPTPTVVDTWQLSHGQGAACHLLRHSCAQGVASFPHVPAPPTVPLLG